MGFAFAFSKMIFRGRTRSSSSRELRLILKWGYGKVRLRFRQFHQELYTNWSRPGLSNFQRARDLFRGKKKLLLEYARSTCDTKSEGTPVERYTLLELKLKFRRRWDEKSLNEYHIRGRRLIKIYLFCLGLLVPYPFDSICNSRWILLTEIHILFYRMIRVVIGTVLIVNSKNRRKLIERKEFYIIRVFWELEELVIFVSPNIQWSSKIIINSPSFPPFETIDLRRGIRMKSKKKKRKER